MESPHCVRSHAARPNVPARRGDVDASGGQWPDPVQRERRMMARERVVTAGEHGCPQPRPQGVDRAPAIYAYVQQVQQPPPAARRDRATPQPELAQLRERHHRVLLARQRTDPPIDVLKRCPDAA
jgi:hypothetical protein